MSAYVIGRDHGLSSEQIHQVRTWVIGSQRDWDAVTRIVVDLDVPECFVQYSGSDFPRHLNIVAMPPFVMAAAKAAQEAGS